MGSNNHRHSMLRSVTPGYLEDRREEWREKVAGIQDWTRYVAADRRHACRRIFALGLAAVVIWPLGPVALVVASRFFRAAGLPWPLGSEWALGGMVLGILATSLLVTGALALTLYALV